MTVDTRPTAEARARFGEFLDCFGRPVFSASTGRAAADSFGAAMDDLDAEIQKYRASLGDLLRLVESMMPGVKHIALQDYALLNEAPMAARRLLAKAVSDVSKG